MAGADAMRERIEAHPWPRGGVEVVRANRGYTLYSRRTGGQVARLRPTGRSDDVQVLWWRREAWATPGDFGPVILPLTEALDFVATESFFLDRGLTPTPQGKRMRSAQSVRRAL